MILNSGIRSILLASILVSCSDESHRNRGVDKADSSEDGNIDSQKKPKENGDNIDAEKRLNRNTTNSNAESIHWHPGHYLDIGKADNKIMTRIARLGEDGFEKFQGAQVTFYWGELQTDSGAYDFSKLDPIHQKLKQMGKHLVVRIEDRTFKQACAGNRIVPAFVGTVTTSNASDQMCVAKVWESANMTHFIDLIKAIYDRYKTEQTFEAIMTQETALPKSSNLDHAGYTRLAHFTQIKRLIEVGQAYSKTIHIMQMVNFLNGGRGTNFPNDLAIAAMEAGAAISNPDTHPTTNSRNAPHDIPVYDAYRALKGRLIVAPNFNTSDLDDELSVDLMKRVYLRAVNEFGAHYVFWNSHGSSKFHGKYRGNFLVDLVLPVVNDTTLPALKNTCPANVVAKRGPC